MVDAKPLWAALYQLLTSVDAGDYEYRRSSIYEVLIRCMRLRVEGNLFIFKELVAREGVEPPTPAFSGPKPFFNQQLNLSRCPQFCDHSVTSADVRLNVGRSSEKLTRRDDVERRQVPPVESIPRH